MRCMLVEFCNDIIQKVNSDKELILRATNDNNKRIYEINNNSREVLSYESALSFYNQQNNFLFYTFLGISTVVLGIAWWRKRLNEGKTEPWW